MYEPYIELAERLNAIVPISVDQEGCFLHDRRRSDRKRDQDRAGGDRRTGVIAFTGGFHGRTIMAMSMTGKVAPYKIGFGPAQPETWHVPFPAPQNDVTVEDSLKYLAFLFKADIDPTRVAAIIIEPVQGEGGFHQAPAELMRELRRICDTYGIVLVADEVQTGYGRTGKMFAMEHYNVQPDLICLAKESCRRISPVRCCGQSLHHGCSRPGGLGGTYAVIRCPAPPRLPSLMFLSARILSRDPMPSANVSRRGSRPFSNVTTCCPSQPSGALAP